MARLSSAKSCSGCSRYGVSLQTRKPPTSYVREGLPLSLAEVSLHYLELLIEVGPPTCTRAACSLSI